MDTNSQQLIKIIIKTPEAIMFTGTAKSITSYNESGLFDVLPLHENFISIIEKEIIVHDEHGSKSFPVDSGVMQVKENTIVVLLGIQALIG